MVFEFDVAVSTHVLLKLGVVRRHWTRVTVFAADYQDPRSAFDSGKMKELFGWTPSHSWRDQ